MARECPRAKGSTSPSKNCERRPSSVVSVKSVVKRFSVVSLERIFSHDSSRQRGTQSR